MSRLHYRIDGSEDGALLILGPSMGTTLDLWEPQMPALAETWRVLRYDLPGHGGSKAWRDVTIGDVASAVLELADGLGVGRFAYAGVSVGGAVGTALAIAEPGRVSHLVLCCTSARFGDPAGWTQRADTVMTEGIEPIAAMIVGRWFTPSFPDPEPYVAMLRAADPEGYAEMCRAISRFDVRDQLGRIAAHTLVISGMQDPGTPPDHGELLANGISGAELVVLDGASHLANVEKPKEVTEAMIRHLAPR
jgi:3-oxoadipate enol-lactonase